MAKLPPYTIVGNNTGEWAPPKKLSVSEVQAMGLGGEGGGIAPGDKGHITVGAGGGWTINGLVVTDAMVVAANKDGTAATPSMRTLGTGAAQACAGNDSRLSDARTPTSHGHAIVNVTGLQAALDGKSATDHTHPGGGGDSVVVLAADVTNNNGVANTIASVTGLAFPVVSGETYWFEFVIPYTAAATTTGSRWSITGPTNSMLAYRSEYTLTATTVTTNCCSAYDFPAASNLSSLTVGNVATIWGHIRVTANGSVTARFASEVLSSAIVAKAGALVRYRKVLP
jgi:hypothetical protein